MLSSLQAASFSIVSDDAYSQTEGKKIMLIDEGEYHDEAMVGQIKNGRFHTKKLLHLTTKNSATNLTIMPIKSKGNFFVTYSYSGGLDIVQSIGLIQTEGIPTWGIKKFGISQPLPMKDCNAEDPGKMVAIYKDHQQYGEEVLILNNKSEIQYESK